MNCPLEPTGSPRTSVVATLARIWCKVLGCDQVGLRDDFFELGGDSIAALEVLLVIEQTFGQKLPLVALRSAPTILDLAQLIEQPSERPTWSAVVPLQRQGTHPPFFCVHDVGGTVLSLAP